MGLKENEAALGDQREQAALPLEVGSKDKKGWTRFHITIEPIKFLVGFSLAFTSGVTIDLLQRNVCYRDYNISYAECTSPNISSEIKADVEASTAQVHMANNFIQGLCPLFLVVFIGPWSDTNGRKPFILWGLRGFLIYYLLWMLFSFFPYIPVVWFFIPSIPLGLTGSVIAIYVCTWSYTCDNFEPEERTMRFSVSVAAMVTGQVIGNSLSEQFLALGGEFGFQIVFLIAFSAILIAFLYATFFLEETVTRKDKKKSKLIDLNHIRSIIDAVILRPAKGRLVVMFVLLVLASEIPAYAGDENIAYLVGKSHYNWSLGQYNLFAALSNTISALGPVAGVWLLMDVGGLTNASALILSSIVLVALQLLKSISVNEIMYWTTALAAKSTNLIGACIDSELVDTVSEDNVGKAFTFTSLLDALSPLVAIPMYTQVYRILLPDKTLYVYFLSFGLNAITLVASIGLFIRKRYVYALSSTEPPSDEIEQPSDESKPVNA